MMNTTLAKVPENMDEQQMFLSILHHDAANRNNYFVRFEIDKKAKEQKDERYCKNTWAFNSSFALTRYDNEHHDVYIGLHSYNRKERDGNHIFSYNAIYFDLDWHYSNRMNELDQRMTNTLNALHEAYENGVLPRPTMITNTGRGIGLFYVLDRSIANTTKTTKQIKFWEYIYSEYARKYEALVSEKESEGVPVLELDWKVVKDKARVVRLPLTKNISAGRMCKIHEVTKQGQDVTYYSLKQLASYIENYGVYNQSEEKRKKIATQKVVDFEKFKLSGFLYQRLKKLERAQEVLGVHGEGSRELLCFYYYNTAKQIYDKERAMEMLREFHGRFHEAIHTSELVNIIRSVNKCQDLEGNVKGFYRITDKTIKEKLELDQKVASGKITQAQADYIGFCDSVKSIQRRKAKEETKRKREERDTKIIQYIQEHEEATYAKIAEVFGVSVRTINNIVKKHNIHRYEHKIHIDEVSTCGTKKTTEKCVATTTTSTSETPSEKEIFKFRTKMQKNALVSSLCCEKLSKTNNPKIKTIGSIKPGTILTYRELERIRGMQYDDDGWMLLDCNEIFG